MYHQHFRISNNKVIDPLVADFIRDKIKICSRESMCHSYYSERHCNLEVPSFSIILENLNIGIFPDMVFCGTLCNISVYTNRKVTEDEVLLRIKDYITNGNTGYENSYSNERTIKKEKKKQRYAMLKRMRSVMH
jgi:hypothetical protein